MLHAITLHLLWVLKFRVYSNAPALDLFSKPKLYVKSLVRYDAVRVAFTLNIVVYSQ